MWDLPRPGVEPMSSTLGGGFLTTEPPGKPRGGILISDLNEGSRLVDHPGRWHETGRDSEWVGRQDLTISRQATHSSVLPGESQGRGSLVGCRLWGRTGLDTTEAT